MKKLFFFAAAMFATTMINAQYSELLTFDNDLANEIGKEAGIWSDGHTWAGDNGMMDITINDNAEKATIDANQAYFGTAEDFAAYESRLKVGGKTTSSNNYTIVADVYSKGTLHIMVRTGSNSATDRTLVVTQDGSELFNEVIKEKNAVEVEMTCESCETGVQTKNVYPIIDLAVETGSVELTFPVGSLNFYAFAFTSEAASAVENVAGATVKAVKVVEDGQIYILKNGVKYNILGTQVTE